MREIKHIVLLGLWVLFGSLSSCNKYLNEPYDNRVELTTVADYRALLSQAYPERQDLFTDILTDDYHHYASMMQASLTATYVPLYLWQDDYVEGTATPARAYAHYYEKIYLANTVIAEVMLSQGDQAAQEALLGEALVVRAYSYFSLVNLFGKHYDKTTAISDLGVPLVLEVTTENNPTFHRATVDAVYQQIENDMAEGLRLMEKHEQLLSTNPYHFRLASVYAFFTRLYLYKEQWDECVTYANKSWELSAAVLRDMAAAVTLLKSYDIAYFAQEFMNPSTNKNILLANQSDVFLTRPTGFRLCGFYPAHSVYYSFPQNDYRYSLFSAGGTVIDSITNHVKYAQQPNQPNIGVSRYDCFTTEEVLLNRAEALMRKTTADRTLALADLELMRQNRLLTYTNLNSTALTDDDILALIWSERRKEFLGQGMRWFDIKRLKLSVEHRLSRTSAQPDAVLTADDPRKVLQIPVSARAGNPVLENELNPR
ncbi:RagB/SusD family nutrient uptake outer membrane protein [Sphingobacterium sp. LRF_L2]|uniref:RagB/SusD family nutrient uptake outer membrane protein n=1 Tax=Sphingobacterium sp. LRF_L2 TaxID=3369421 RepID=UPI003F63BD5D